MKKKQYFNELFEKTFKEFDRSIVRSNHAMIARGFFGKQLRAQRRLMGEDNFYDTMIRTCEEKKQRALEEITLSRLSVSNEESPYENKTLPLRVV